MPPEEKNDLLASICHDLRAPLAAVTMGANFVLQTTEDDEAHARERRVLSAMLRSCAQMERLIRNFADLSEIEGGAIVLAVANHDVTEMLALVGEEARGKASERSIVLEERSTTRATIACDRERVLRGFGHLVDNALRAAPEGSTVTIRASERGGDIVFEVVDAGPGIAPQLRQHLFDRRFLAKRTERMGAGFGLAIARGYAVAHRGRVEVESARGATTVTMILPKAGPSA